MGYFIGDTYDYVLHVFRNGRVDCLLDKSGILSNPYDQKCHFSNALQKVAI